MNLCAGQGSYAVVKLAIDKLTNKQYAVKIYEKFKLVDPHKMNNVKREISILKGIDHPNIIKLFFACEDRRQVYLIYLKKKIS